MDNVIRFNSFKHILLYIAEKVISSYRDESILGPFFHMRKKNQGM